MRPMLEKLVKKAAEKPRALRRLHGYFTPSPADAVATSPADINNGPGSGAAFGAVGLMLPSQPPR